MNTPLPENGKKHKLPYHYAYTWSPAPNVTQGLHKPDMQLDACLTVIKEAFKRMNTANYNIYPEFHVSGKIHFHFIVDATYTATKVQLFKQCLPTLKRHGYICAKSDVDTGWNDYIQKEETLITEIFPDIDMYRDDKYVGLQLVKECNRLALKYYT